MKSHGIPFSLLFVIVLSACGGGGGGDSLPPTVDPPSGPDNEPPTISGTPAQSVMAGQSYSFTPTASDSDGDSLSFSISNMPGWASFDTGSGALTGTPSQGDAGTYSAISITVSDGTDTADLPSFAVSVIGNQPPVISGTPDTEVMAGSPYSFTPTASDADGDSLVFGVGNLPAWAGFDTGSGALTGTPAQGDAGTYSAISITVSDGTDTAQLPAFDITVTGNRPPVISGTPNPTAMAGSPYAFTPTASDADGDSLTFHVINLPSWASFDAGSGALTGTPSAADVGTYADIVIVVTDGMASAALDAFAITVTDSATGTALLEWTPPVLDGDDTSLTDLTGFKVYYGTAPGVYPNVVDVPSAGVSSFLVENLAPATYFFVVTAYDTLGNESDPSNETSKVVP